jgi:hypothetical protein
MKLSVFGCKFSVSEKRRRTVAQRSPFAKKKMLRASRGKNTEGTEKETSRSLHYAARRARKRRERKNRAAPVGMTILGVGRRFEKSGRV